MKNKIFFILQHKLFLKPFHPKNILRQLCKSLFFATCDTLFPPKNNLRHLCKSLIFATCNTPPLVTSSSPKNLKVQLRKHAFCKLQNYNFCKHMSRKANKQDLWCHKIWKAVFHNVFIVNPLQRQGLNLQNPFLCKCCKNMYFSDVAWK